MHHCLLGWTSLMPLEQLLLRHIKSLVSVLRSYCKQLYKHCNLNLDNISQKLHCHHRQQLEKKRLSGNERKKIICIKKSACGAQSRELCFIKIVSETVTISGEKSQT